MTIDTTKKKTRMQEHTHTITQTHTHTHTHTHARAREHAHTRMRAYTQREEVCTLNHPDSVYFSEICSGVPKITLSTGQVKGKIF